MVLGILFGDVQSQVSSGPTTYLQDSFTDTNGTNLNAHIMDVGPGWTIDAGTFDIQSNQGRVTSAGVSVASADASHADVTATVKTTVAGVSDSPSLLIRETDSNNHWIAAIITTSSFDLYEVNGGSFTQRATTLFVATLNQQYTIRAICSGASISCTLDGANNISYGSATFNQTATRFGIRSNDGAGTNFLWDDFLVTS